MESTLQRNHHLESFSSRRPVSQRARLVRGARVSKEQEDRAAVVAPTPWDCGPPAGAVPPQQEHSTTRPLPALGLLCVEAMTPGVRQYGDQSSRVYLM